MKNSLPFVVRLSTTLSTELSIEKPHLICQKVPAYMLHKGLYKQCAKCSKQSKTTKSKKIVKSHSTADLPMIKKVCERRSKSGTESK